MFEPTNEQGVIVLFAQQAQQAGFEIIEIGSQYPDALIGKGGKTYKTEFEFQSSNFLSHNHDPGNCDLIICYDHDWNDCPLPVIELKNPEWSNANLDKDIYKLADWWRKRALNLEDALNSANGRLAKANGQLEKLKELKDKAPIPPGKKTREIAYEFLSNAHAEGYVPTGLEVSRYIGKSDSLGRKLKRELWPGIAGNGNGNDTGNGAANQ